jgi:tetratricopeptide (TPR) repeat protein
MHTFRYLLLTLLLLNSTLALSEPSTLDPRLVSLDKLINTSSGAQQVLKSRDGEVKALHQLSKGLFNQANNEFKIGNDEEAKALLNQSTKTMFKAIRLATPSSLNNAKLKVDYDKRKESINTLSSAFNRIADEKEKCDCKDKTNEQIKTLVNQADKLLQDGQHVIAKVELDKAYQILQVSIESLRGGQTLVRSLNFATPEEEYEYELDRNHTHKMLIKLLLDDKASSEYTQKKVDEFTNNARLLREKAEISALQKRFEDAIQHLENSTKELVRAIRTAGIYIPG